MARDIAGKDLTLAIFEEVVREHVLHVPLLRDCVESDAACRWMIMHVVDALATWSYYIVAILAVLVYFSGRTAWSTGRTTLDAVRERSARLDLPQTTHVGDANAMKTE
jgi:hypothetical protein